MTQAIGSASSTSQYAPFMQGQNPGTRPVGLQAMQDAGYGSADPSSDPSSGGVPSAGAQYYPYANGGSYANGGDYFNYMGTTSNPDLSQALNLDPLQYSLYSGFDGQTADGGYTPFNGAGSQNGPPPPPSYIGDSPAGFAANVIDPNMALATATYAQTKNMLDDYDQAHPDGSG